MKKFSEYIQEIEKKTLYIHRPLLNAPSLIEWAKSHGCITCLKPESMHVTQCYSKTPMIWPRPLMNIVRVEVDNAEVHQFGGGATVLKFDYKPFMDRDAALKELGATSDFPTYQSHVTLTYEGEGLDIESFPKFSGTLIFGPEVLKEIDIEKKWKNANLEESVNMQFDDAESLRGHYEKKYPGISLDLFDSTIKDNSESHLSLIHVPKELRRQGIGSDVMRAITSYGDRTGRTITLSPERRPGGPGKSILVKWYKSHGFVPNRGRNKDYRISTTMYRRPSE